MTQHTTQHLFICRMTHIDNVSFIVQNGLWSKLSPVQDPNFIPIGNPDIIDKRTNKTVVVIPPGGVLGESLPGCKIKVDTEYEYYYRGYD